MTTFLRQLQLFRREVCLYLVTPALIGVAIFGGVYTALGLSMGPSLAGAILLWGYITLVQRRQLHRVALSNGND
ncbi:MAG: hypothetical protein R2867_03010 [Caldilineaceae bacterium]